MTDAKLLRRLAALEIADDQARARAVTTIPSPLRATQRTRVLGRTSSRIRAALAGIGILAALAISPIGPSLAHRAVDLDPFTDDPKIEAQMAAAERRERWWDQTLVDTAAKAAAGQLKADVNPERVVRVLLDWVHRPTGAEGKHLEDEMIFLLKKLRAADDFPPIGAGPHVP